MKPPHLFSLLVIAQSAVLPLKSVAAEASATSATFKVDQSGKPISPDLVGIFFEDLSYAADGGLYAELVQNRSFEYQCTEQKTWNNFTSWDFTTRGKGKGSWAIDDSFPVHPNNPHYMVIETGDPGDGVGIVNSGFDGIPIQAGEKYDISFFGRQLFVGARWGSENRKGSLPLVARLEGKNGELLGEASFSLSEQEWQHFTAKITANQTDASARLVLLTKAKGGIGLDEISLFPEKTFHNHPNGLRPDLAQTIADLKPKFMRFPGGCLVHGSGLGNMYRWKDTIGPIEQRRQQANLWGYHQTVGLGYYEYFQFCEDIGAKPLPVVAAGVCCQNSGHTGGGGQRGLPLDQMPAYIQDVLDLIEWANGTATSEWGSKRAAAGHPEPFHLQYLGVGNEDHITPVFKERFQMIFDAVRKKHPEITVVGTVGPSPKGEDYDNGWKIADELHVPIVDEHYYERPDWFWNNLKRYDTYDRKKSMVYLGEYAASYNVARDSGLPSALAEAAHLTSLERNGDIVHMASYAPLLARREYTRWNPDLIYFSKTEVFPTVNYQVQKLFSINSGDTYLSNTLEGLPDGAKFAASSVRDSKSGDLILKFVNGGSTTQPLHVDFSKAGKLASTATRTVLAANPIAMDGGNASAPVLPASETVSLNTAFDYQVPPNSLTVFRIASHLNRESK